VKFARVSRGRTDTAIVPRHHEVPVGTLRSILTQAHIDAESWGKTLRRLRLPGRPQLRRRDEANCERRAKWLQGNSADRTVGANSPPLFVQRSYAGAQRCPPARAQDRPGPESSSSASDVWSQRSIRCSSSLSRRAAFLPLPAQLPDQRRRRSNSSFSLATYWPRTSVPKSDRLYSGRSASPATRLAFFMDFVSQGGLRKRLLTICVRRWNCTFEPTVATHPSAVLEIEDMQDL
jgi:hypothetical protein